MNKILLIENEDTGIYYKELMEKSIDNIEIIWVKNRKDALAAYDEYQFKIVVYDQRLDNNELGTEVMSEIKKKNQNVLGIMLSAHATPYDTVQAGKNDLLFEYINKSQVDILPVKIIDALRFYDINKAIHNKQERIYIGKTINKGMFLHPIKYYLCSQQLVNSNYIYDESWKDLYLINAGEEQCQKKSVEISKTIKIVNEYHNEQSGNMSVNKVGDLIGTFFQHSVSLSNTNETTETHNEIDELVKTYKMPEIPQTIHEDYPTTVIFQCAQIYKRYEIIVLEECSCCEHSTYEHFTVYIPTNNQKYRKVITYNSGKQDILEVSARD